jgi:hypothetical protein
LGFELGFELAQGLTRDAGRYWPIGTREKLS